MSKVRIVPISKHGGSICVTITELAEDLGWKPEDEVRIEMEKGRLTITKEAA